MTKRGWEQHERDIQEMFGLDSTICSGNRFHDAGDGVHRGRGFPFPVYAECKYTEKLSKTLKLLEIADAEVNAADAGKRMIMPIRFWRRTARGPEDYVLISAHDLAELLDMVNGGHDAERL